MFATAAVASLPPPLILFSFSPSSNSVMNMEMKLSPAPPLPLYFFLIPFLFPVWESLFPSLPLSGRPRSPNEWGGMGTQEFMECLASDGLRCFRAQASQSLECRSGDVSAADVIPIVFVALKNPFTETAFAVAVFVTRLVTARSRSLALSRTFSAVCRLRGRPLKWTAGVCVLHFLFQFHCCNGCLIWGRWAGLME